MSLQASLGDVPTAIVTHEPRRTGLLGGARGDGRDGILHERRF